MHWRDTMRPARFLGIDARIFVLLLLFIFHMKLWTFILAVSGVLALRAIEARGLTLPAAARWVRAFLAGKKRPAIAAVKHRRFADLNTCNEAQKLQKDAKMLPSRLKKKKNAKK